MNAWNHEDVHAASLSFSTQHLLRWLAYTQDKNVQDEQYVLNPEEETKESASELGCLP